MINISEVIETNAMIEKENLDVRTVTLGISLLDCISDNLDVLNDNIFRKITTVARDLVRICQQIEREYALPIVNKRISVTPVALIGASACRSPEDYVTIAKTLDRAAHKVGLCLCEPRFDEDRYQHGCSPPHGPHNQRDCRAYKGP